MPSPSADSGSMRLDCGDTPHSSIIRPALPRKNLHSCEALPDVDLIQEKIDLGFIPVRMTPQGEARLDTSEILDQLEE